MRKHLLHTNWKVILHTQSDLQENVEFPEEGITAQVPGTIHTDLLSADMIKDPFYADNEKKLSWISEIDWIYQTEFTCPQDFDYNKPIYLVFEGLDTIAEIKFNDAVLGRTENMFRKYEYDVTKYIKKGNNKLQVRFESPLRYGREKIQSYGKLFAARKQERAYIRKAQYSFGWDWGPAYPTMGIWRPVYLIQYREGRIENIKFDTINLKNNQAKVLISWECLGDVNELGLIKVHLSNNTTSLEKSKDIISSLADTIEFDISDPDLWWPNGEGEQNLYLLEVSLLNKKNELIDKWNAKVGIRKIELKLKEDGINVFRFIVNEKPVYAKGVNWIPADSFIPRLNVDFYEELLTLAQQAHINMIRVWGGGIYEQEIFYELCDILGIMVWQDFMFACSSYPEDDNFLENVSNEVIENILRLQYHPSLVIWCGNNENEWIWYRENMGSYREMPGFRIFHELIPSLIKKFDPYRPYWPTSPFGQDEDPNSALSGNRHQWDIWSRWVDYMEVQKDQSLFVTEFGFQGPANRNTIESVIPASDRYPQSSMFEYHNKQIEGNERLFRYLAAHFPVTTKWEDFLYLTQLNQGLALKTCLEHWRLRWPETGGSLIWQLNDCWPVTSWSLIDSQRLPKLAYYFVKHTCAPCIVAFRKEGTQVELIVSNHATEQFNGRFELYEIITAQGHVSEIKSAAIQVKAGVKLSVVKESMTPALFEGESTLIATLRDKTGKLIHRNYFLNGRWKYLKLRQPNIQLEYFQDKNEKKLKLNCNFPAFFVTLQHPDYIFSDNGMILFPGQNYPLTLLRGNLSASETAKIKIYTLNQFL